MTQNTQPMPIFDTVDYFNPQIELTCSYAVPADYQHAYNFLYSYRGNPETFKAYRREIERLLQWAWLIQKTSIKKLKSPDFEIFFEFCLSPPKNWVSTKHVTRFIEQDGQRMPNPAWRPFVMLSTTTSATYQFSQSALQAVFSILSSFYSYLEQESYVNVNPITRIRQKSKFLRKYQTKRQVRRLSELQWEYVLETAELMAKENPKLHERTLFIINALFAMYLRISELASSKRWTPEMGHFYRDMDTNWWFKTIGKGNKERDISVSDAMLAALRRYRQSLGLLGLPTPNESTPLIPRISGKTPITGTRHIRKIVQACFDRAIERLTADNFIEEAELLTKATVHWLRHTGISEDVRTRPREHVRDDAGHSSSSITDRYIDVELRARHASAKKKLIKNYGK